MRRHQNIAIPPEIYSSVSKSIGHPQASDVDVISPIWTKVLGQYGIEAT